MKKLLLLLLLNFIFVYPSDFTGTLLLIEANTWSSGNLVLMNCATEEKVTLVEGSVYGPRFSPDGTKIAYCLNKEIHIIDVFGENDEKIYTLENNETLSWSEDNCLFWTKGRYMVRYNMGTEILDSVHFVKGEFNTDWPDSIIYASYGNTSADGKRGAYVVSRRHNRAVSMEFGGEEVVINDGTATHTSCQATISRNGDFVAAVNYTHRDAWIKPFNNNDSIVGYLTQPPDGSLWMLRFSSSSNNHLIFHSPRYNPTVYLWKIDEENEYTEMATDMSGWDYYADGWVQDLASIDRREGLKENSEPFVNVYPNPFNPVVNIAVSCKELGVRSFVSDFSLKIFNIKGILVEDLSKTTNSLQLTSNSFTWNATNHPTGIYVVKLSYGNKTYSKRISLIK